MAKLYFYYSAMNAGKTTTLLQSNFNYRERGMKTLLFAPDVDTRYGCGNITSRIGLHEKARPFDRDFDFLPFVKAHIENQGPVDCILVDEAQFLSEKQVYALTEIVDRLDLPVLTYGLRTDFLGQPFEGSRYLLAWADVLVEIKTVCHCGRKATMNSHRDFHPATEAASINVIDIGGNDKYVSTCRVHFKSHTLDRGVV